MYGSQPWSCLGKDPAGFYGVPLDGFIQDASKPVFRQTKTEGSHMPGALDQVEE